MATVTHSRAVDVDLCKSVSEKMLQAIRMVCKNISANLHGIQHGEKGSQQRIYIEYRQFGFWRACTLYQPLDIGHIKIHRLYHSIAS